MQIYTNFKDDESASATLQMSAAEFKGIREFMHTPVQFPNVKFPNGVYLNKTGFGWYRLSTSNDVMIALKLESAVTLIRKIDRKMRGVEGKEEIRAPRPLGVHFKSEAHPVQQQKPRPLIARLLARA